MGIPVADARDLSYWEFSAVRWEWGERQKRPDDQGGGEPVEPPSAEFVRERQRELAELGISGTGA